MIYLKVRKKGDGRAAVRKMTDALRGPDRVQVGFPAGTDTDVVAKAVFNEFGTSTGIPERPFLRNAMTDNRDGYRGMMTRAARKIIESEGKFTKQHALAQLGLKAQGDVQKSITDLREPPNAPATIKRKGSSNPLIDTGEMRARVTFKVGDPK